jgi:protease II
MGAGHGGPSGRYDALRETAFTYPFQLSQMGRNGGGVSSQPHAHE